jgi:hypothetical protein
MGGSKDPTLLGPDNLITLCRTCHRNIHEGGWALERSPQLLQVVDRLTGQEVMRRHFHRGFDAAAYLDLLGRLHLSLDQAAQFVRYLDDEQLVEAFEDARCFGKRAWLLQAAILYEAQRRSVYGDHSLEGIARRFEVSLRQAQKYALVWRLFFAKDGHNGEHEEAAHEAVEPKDVNVDAFFLEEPSWYMVAATESPDPHRWLAYAQDKKAENPRYSIGDFRGDVQQAVRVGVRVLQEETAQLSGAAPRISWGCPWVRPYCTRSGRPVPAAGCPCEAEE